MAEVWARTVHGDANRRGGVAFNADAPECPATIIDMQARGSLYLMCRFHEGGSVWAQKWSLAGDLDWSIELPHTKDGDAEHWRPLRIDSDDAQVWIVGDLPEVTNVPPQAGIYALDAADGSTVWTKTGGAWDVEPSVNAGNCYITGGATTACEGSASSIAPGGVHELDDTGATVLRFGPALARSILNGGGGIWVGTETQVAVDCVCDGAGESISGIMHKYSSTGDWLLTCAGGEWVESSGCKVQVPLLFHPTATGWITRLCVTPDGTVMGGAEFADDGQCLFYEVDADDGALLNTFDVSVTAANKVNGLASDGTETYAVVSGLLYLFSGGSRRHRGYLTGEDATKTIDGTYTAVTAVGSSIFVGGTAAGCVLDDDTDAEDIVACDGAQPCECGDFNASGEAVVGCGCEDGVIPCEGIIYHSWTGCLAEMPSPITMEYQHCNAEDCDENGHSWVGQIPLFSIDPEAEIGDPCSASLTGTVTVCYECGVGWKIVYKLYSGGLWAEFTGTITNSYCNPPSFTFSFDGTWDYQSSQAATCCGGTTGCGGMNNENGCGPTCTACPDGAPVGYVADMSGFEQGAGTCTTCGDVGNVDLEFVGEVMGDCTWEGAMTFCEETFTVRLIMSGSTVGINVIDEGASIVAEYGPDDDPFDCLAGGTFTQTSLSYSGTECTVWPTSISVSVA